jgi:hypothetical protein
MREIHPNLSKSSTPWGREVDSTLKDLQKASVANQGSIRAAIRNCNHTRERHVDNLNDYGWHFPEYIWPDEHATRFDIEPLDGKKIVLSDQIYGIVATDTMVYSEFGTFHYKPGNIQGVDYQQSSPDFGNRKYFAFVTNIVGNPDFWSMLDSMLTFPRQYQYRVHGPNDNFVLEKITTPGVYLEGKQGFFGYSKNPTHWSIWSEGFMPNGMYVTQQYLITNTELTQYLSTGAGVQTCSVAPWLIGCSHLGDEGQYGLEGYGVNCGAACIVIDSLEDN